MSELENRLETIEYQLQIVIDELSPKPAGTSVSPQLEERDDVIDLGEFWKALWQGKWLIMAAIFFFLMIGIFFALSLPNLYKSEGVYASAPSQSGLGGLVSQYSGLAAMAGINLSGEEGSDIDQALALVQSWPFLEQVIEENGLKPFVMGIKGWNPESGELLWDDKIYDATRSQWVRHVSPPQPKEPTSYEVYEEFAKMLSVSKDKKTGLVNIAIEYYSPELAQQWVVLIIQSINRHFQLRDMKNAEANIKFLDKKIENTSISEMREVFYSMIETQTKTLMLTEVSDEYLLKTVIPPKVSEEKSAPSRALIVALFVLLGGVFGGLGVLLRKYNRVETRKSTSLSDAA